MEIWKPVKGNGFNNYFTKYLVSNKGRVKSLWKNKTIILKQSLSRPKNGYSYVNLCSDCYGKVYHRRIYIHRLVADSFLNPNNDNYIPSIKHLDGDLTNNNLSNLMYEDR